jgi:hypothetical protein
MPTKQDPKDDIRPDLSEETPAAPRSGAGDDIMPLLPFGEDPGTIDVDDPPVE